MDMMEVPEPFGCDTPSLGCWLKVPSSTTAEVAAQAGFDYVCIDTVSYTHLTLPTKA